MTTEAGTQQGLAANSRLIARALQKATADFKGFAALILAFATTISAFIVLRDIVVLEPPWPAIGCLLPVPVFLLFYVWPEWLTERSKKRLTDLGIHGELNTPEYFQLKPYEPDDAGRFRRADHAHVLAVRWIQASDVTYLYLFGQSGTGKSSLTNAVIVPMLSNDSNWKVIPIRAHDGLVAEITRVLSTANAVWRRPPRQHNGAGDLIQRAAEYCLQKSQRLLIVVDQFEGEIAASDEERRHSLATLFASMRNIRNLRFLLIVRAEYLSDLPTLGLPDAEFGKNCFEVRAFTHSAARDFFVRSGLEFGPILIDKVLEEAAQIEEMPDRVRPIVLNMFGFVLGSFKGVLPKGVDPGRLLSNYVERALSAPDVRLCASDIMKCFVTELGTMRAQTVLELAARTKSPQAMVKGCLLRLGTDGLVRPIDPHGTRWELSHDFVARLIQPLVQNWRRSVWERARGWLGTGVLLICLGAIAAAYFSPLLYPSLYQAQLLRNLGQVGLVTIPSDYPGFTALGFNGAAEVTEDAMLAEIGSLQALSPPVAFLDLERAPIDSFYGFPELRDIRSVKAAVNGDSESLRGLEHFPNLESLSLVVTQIGLDQLSVVRSLRNLTLYGDVSGSGVLRDSRNLNSLSISMSSVPFSAADLPKGIEGVSFSGTNVVGLESLVSHASTLKLLIWRSPLITSQYMSEPNDWKFLQKLTNLEVLIIWDPSFRDLSLLDQISELKVVELSGSQNLSPLVRHKSVQNIYLPFGRDEYIIPEELMAKIKRESLSTFLGEEMNVFLYGRVN